MFSTAERRYVTAGIKFSMLDVVENDDTNTCMYVGLVSQEGGVVNLGW